MSGGAFDSIGNSNTRLAISWLRFNGPNGEAALAARAAGIRIEVVRMWNKPVLSTGHVGVNVTCSVGMLHLA